MEKKVVSTILSATALVGVANAGTTLVAPEEAKAPNAGSWCDTLANIGKIYKSDNNPYIQEFNFNGRAHYQIGHSTGDVDGNNFSETGDEIRRLRFGLDAKLLNRLSLKAILNLEDGGFRDTSFGYSDWDELNLTYNVGNVAGFEGVKVQAGRLRYNFGQEVHFSSKVIKTIERTSASNYFYQGGRPTGVALAGSKSGIDYAFTVANTGVDPDIARWDDGTMFLFNMAFDAAGGRFQLDFTYDNAEEGSDDDFLGYEWGSSIGYVTKVGNWDLLLNGLIGSTSEESDSLYAFVVMPSTFIVEDKLEFVARYQYFGSDGDHVKVGSRNVGQAYKSDQGASIASGDSNHNLYAGLNWYLCGDNSKVMVGAEYDIQSGDAANSDVDAATLWVAYRMFF